MPRARLHQLLIEQFVEREPASPQLGVFDLLGPVHQFERGTQLDQLCAARNAGG